MGGYGRGQVKLTPPIPFHTSARRGYGGGQVKLTVCKERVGEGPGKTGSLRGEGRGEAR